ncbi:S24/S26 family peptidase [Xanthocytophaga agilis]|uniref:S24/S26 family peptidase n=1 Tax=Xanthocytophaga agilis TaxID=3048010 RepID=A0AAE3R347_9BACT|nr:S24/S26 family peptidase [Xanthocytophaga agilis]MDJ1500500.1 S24/S26 family peptidase [Xanthocytophaga agilis]
MLLQNYYHSQGTQTNLEDISYIMPEFKKIDLKRLDVVIKSLKDRLLIRSQAHFAALLGVKDQYITDLKKGKTPQKEEFLTNLYDTFPQINRDFLETGAGDPLNPIDIMTFTHPDNDHSVNDNQTEYIVSKNGDKESGVVYYKELDLVDLDKVKRIKIPVVEIEVAASFVQNVNGQYSINDVAFNKETIERIPGIKYTSLTLVFQIRGDSMYPNYREREKILCTWIDTDWWDIVRDVCVVSLKNGSLILKRVVASDREKGTIVLKSDNELYGDMTVNIDEIQGMWRMEYFVLAFKR